MCYMAKAVKLAYLSGFHAYVGHTTTIYLKLDGIINKAAKQLNARDG